MSRLSKEYGKPTIQWYKDTAEVNTWLNPIMTYAQFDLFITQLCWILDCEYISIQQGPRSIFRVKLIISSDSINGTISDCIILGRRPSTVSNELKRTHVVSIDHYSDRHITHRIYRMSDVASLLSKITCNKSYNYQIYKPHFLFVFISSTSVSVYRTEM